MEWRDVATSQGMLGHPELEEVGSIFLPLPQSLWGEHGPAHTLISDVQPPDLGEDVAALEHQAPAVSWGLCIHHP